VVVQTCTTTHPGLLPRQLVQKRSGGGRGVDIDLKKKPDLNQTCGTIRGRAEGRVFEVVNTPVRFRAWNFLTPVW